MSQIITENITHTYAARKVLDGVSVHLSAGDRVGLVGANGEGKTTLLRILGGMLEPTEGSVHRRRGLRTGYLAQDPPAMADTTLHQAMLGVFNELRELETALHELADAMGGDDATDQMLERYGQMQARFESAGGYDYHLRVEQILTGLSFERDMWDMPLSQFSGGQRTRAYLATLLLQEPDILMLDEPTNHLDMDSVEWLEGWLGRFAGTAIVVSHDRYFLDQATNATWEIDAGRLERYRGGYSEYLPKRIQRYQERLATWQSQQEYITETQEFIRRNLAGQRTKEAQGRRTRLERFIRDEGIERPRRLSTIHVNFTPGGRTGDIVLQAKGLSIGYDASEALVTSDELQVDRLTRLAIVGPNGCGKTTLIRTLMDELPALAGQVRLGANVKVGYLSQTHANLDGRMTAAEAVVQATGSTTEQALSALGSLLLSGDEAMKPIDELSGGQRSRVVLADLMLGGANLLILDEPTNHLDIPSTEILQDALKRFEGSVIFVSHDRYLIEAVATEIWAIDNRGIKLILGGWEDYLRWRGQVRDHADSSRAAPADDSKNAKQEARKDARRQANLLQRLQKRHAELETEINRVERRLAELNDEMSAASQAGDLELIGRLGTDYASLDVQLKSLWDEWEQVGEELE